MKFEKIGEEKINFKQYNFPKIGETSIDKFSPQYNSTLILAALKCLCEIYRIESNNEND